MVLLSLLTFLTVIGATIAMASAGSVSTRPGAESRVRAIATLTGVLVGPRGPRSSTGVGVSGLHLRQVVSATGVATNAGPDFVAGPI
jgi:hypothetical protein